MKIGNIATVAEFNIEFHTLDPTSHTTCVKVNATKATHILLENKI